MACGLVASNLNLKPGECLRVRGEVAPEAKSFVLNLGKDSNNLCLHFNPRFNAHGDTNTIVCNSKDGGAWGAEHREPAFPFQPGSVVEACVSRQGSVGVGLTRPHSQGHHGHPESNIFSTLAAERALWWTSAEVFPRLCHFTHTASPMLG
ncbi:galectin-1 [Octodon degus]|uniref:Galectin n=1 Tax=Octodon degus TaxID=10160 RepID=A0A6P6ERV3_OCTDE|nr:galectin-1 [Octodon degus]